jgi:hypothetical protein
MWPLHPMPCREMAVAAGPQTPLKLIGGRLADLRK